MRVKCVANKLWHFWSVYTFYAFNLYFSCENDVDQNKSKYFLLCNPKDWIGGFDFSKSSRLITTTATTDIDEKLILQQSSRTQMLSFSASKLVMFV